tara:strand:- start:8117 stop:9469 length:1353 start_codon:yes stop_codon:yes gene_type:complete
MSQLGYDNLLWFMGVVEDRKDPQKLGRVRVRCFNVHPQDKGAVATEDLPWAYLISGTFSADIKPPKLNTWVFGFFVDGRDAQHPMIIGALNGMPTQLPKFSSDGEIDGYGNLMHKDDVPDIYEPDFSRLARGEKLEETSVLTKNIMSNEVFKTADERGWTIPKSPYNTEYPHNRVYESSAGHIMEFDDTKGSERINIYHKAGTWIEIDSLGNLNIIASGKKTEVTLKDSKVYVRGNQDVTVEGNATLYVQKNATMKIDGDLDATVKGDYNINVGKSFNLNVREGIKVRGANVLTEAMEDNIETYAAVSNINYATEFYSMKSGKDLFIESAENINILSTKAIYGKATTDLSLVADEDGFITIGGGGHIKAENTLNIQSSGSDVDVKGTKINLNTDGKGVAETGEDATAAFDAAQTELKEPPEGGNVVPSDTLSQEDYGIIALDDTADIGAQ